MDPFHGSIIAVQRRRAHRQGNGWPYATSYDTHVLDMAKLINVYGIRYDREGQPSEVRIDRAGRPQAW